MNKKRKTPTPKERVLARYPDARCVYDGLSPHFVILVGGLFTGNVISGRNLRISAAWRSAARRLTPKRGGKP